MFEIIPPPADSLGDMKTRNRRKVSMQEVRTLELFGRLHLGFFLYFFYPQDYFYEGVQINLKPSGPGNTSSLFGCFSSFDGHGDLLVCRKRVFKTLH